MKVHAASLVLLSAFSIETAAAQGGPPLVTDDPGTPGAGRWEVNVAVTLEHNRGETMYEAPLLDLNYGVGDRIQFKWEVPLRVVTSRGSATLAGIGNSLLGVKWRFIEENGMALSTYPQLELNNPTSSVTRGVAEPGKRLFLPLELAKSWDKIGINGEVGYEVAQDDQNSWAYGLAARYEVSKWEALGECTASSLADSEETGILCSLGARHPFGSGLTGLVAVGHRVAGPMKQQPSWRYYLGVQGNWGGSTE